MEPSGSAAEERPRHVHDLALHAATVFRVTVVNGPRQAGKSTLLRQLHRTLGGTLLNLDLEALRAAALADPSGFILSASPIVYVDEFQRGGDALVRAIKARVDDPANATRFVVTGSTNFLSVPVLAESLAGRAALLELWPFSQGEIDGHVEQFVDLAFNHPAELAATESSTLVRDDYLRRICAGGYPEPLGLAGRMRSTWYRSYVQTVTQRDILEGTKIRQAEELPRLLRFLAASTGQELVKTELARRTGIERNTLANYLPLLSTAFLVREVPAWSRNPLGKVTKHPKVALADTGLAASLTGVDQNALALPIAPMRGPLIETFVHNEIIKQLTWCETEATVSHWRDRAGAEVDLVLEATDGRVIGIEAKASLDVGNQDFKWLRRMEAKLGGQFRHGIVFYLGPRALRFGPNLSALPLSALWTI